MLRVSLDSSVYIGTLISRGGGSRLLAMARAGEIQIDTSEAILKEIGRVLREKLLWDGYRIADTFQKLRQFTNVVTPTQTLDVIKEDPPDNRILECAVEAGSDYIVTWDKDLLRLKEYEGIKILMPVQFLERGRAR